MTKREDEHAAPSQLGVQEGTGPEAVVTISPEVASWMQDQGLSNLFARVDGRTALHVAACQAERQPEMAAMIPKLINAVRSQNAELCDSWLNARVEGNPEGRQEGWNCLHLLANNPVRGNSCKADAIRALCSARAHLEATRGQGMTPLLMAAGTAHSQAIQALLEYRADVKARSDKGVTALDLCWHNQECAQFLQECGAVKGAGPTGEGRRPPQLSGGRGVRRAASPGGRSMGELWGEVGGGMGEVRWGQGVGRGTGARNGGGVRYG